MTGNDYVIQYTNDVGVLHTRLGENVVINHLIGYQVQELAEKRFIDTVIVDTEDGFSQLGMMRHFVSQDLGIPERNLAKHILDGVPQDFEKNISSLADWNRDRATEVTLVAFPSERKESLLKGLILVPYDDSKSYLNFAANEYAKPYRDFMYNITYEAISFAHNKWGSRRIGLNHFSRSKYRSSHSKISHHFQHDVTTYQVEAIAHFCNENPGMESFTFLDDSSGNFPLEILKEYTGKWDVGSHRTICTKETKHWGISFIEMNWT